MIADPAATGVVVKIDAGLVAPVDESTKPLPCINQGYPLLSLASSPPNLPSSMQSALEQRAADVDSLADISVKRRETDLVELPAGAWLLLNGTTEELGVLASAFIVSLIASDADTGTEGFLVSRYGTLNID